MIDALPSLAAGLARDLVVALLVFAISLRAFLAIFCALSHLRYASYLRHKGERVPIAGLAVVRAIAREVRAIVRLVRMSPTFLFDGYRLGKSAKPGRPVVCVHGYTQNGTNFFSMRRALARAGHATYAPSLGLPLVPVDVHAALLERAIDRAVARSDGGGRFAIVAHSMGGLVVRRLFALRPELAARCDVVVTIGTPHRGTAGARGFPIGPDVRAMQRGSSFLAALPDLAATCPQARRIEIAGRVDWVVYPLSTSLTPGAEHVVLEAPGHAGLLVDDAVTRIVTEALSDPRPRDAKA